MILSDNLRGALFMICGMAGFTFNDACMKLVTEDLPLFQAIFLRGVGTSVLLVVVCLHQGALHFRVSGADRRVIGLRTLGEIGATVCFLTALMHMPLANVTAILQSLPLAVTLAGALFLGEAVGWRRVAAIIAGFAGVLLIVRPGTEGFDRYSVLAVVAVCFVVLRDLSTRRLSPGVSSAAVALVTAVSITLFAATVSAFETWVRPDGRALGLLSAAAICLVGGYLFIVLAMRAGEIAVVAPFRYTGLLWALVLGWAVFGDFPTTLTLAGATIVVGTGLFTFYRERRLRRAAGGAG